MAESERLVTALGEQEIAVRNIVVNQVLSDQDAASQYVERLSKGQGKCVAELEEVGGGWCVVCGGC